MPRTLLDLLYMDLFNLHNNSVLSYSYSPHSTDDKIRI